jgi:hypothetical protein
MAGREVIAGPDIPMAMGLVPRPFEQVDSCSCPASPAPTPRRGQPALWVTPPILAGDKTADRGGIGSETARQQVTRGANVALLDVDDERLEEVTKELGDGLRGSGPMLPASR